MGTIHKIKMKNGKMKITVWKDRKHEFRWHFKRCGRIVAESGEGYKRVQGCTKALTNIMRCISSLNYSWVDIEKVLPIRDKRYVIKGCTDVLPISWRGL